MSTAVIVKSPPVAIGVVTNPNAKRNRKGAQGGARRAALERIVGSHGVVCETASLDVLGDTVERLLDRRVRYLVADGGDGTLHWVLNETRRALGGSLEEAPQFVPACGGTINFVARRAGLRPPGEALLAALVRAERTGVDLPIAAIDTLEITGRGLDGEPFARAGFCAALGGVGQRFFDVYYNDARPGPWTIVKVIARGLASMAAGVPPLCWLTPRRWRAYAEALTSPARARVHVDGALLPGEQWRALDVGAFPVSFGGVVRLFRLAEQGRFHALTGNPSLLGIALTTPRLVFGARLKHGLTDRAATSLDVQALDPGGLHPVIDGERLPPLAALAVRPGPRVCVPRLRDR